MFDCGWAFLSSLLPFPSGGSSSLLPHLSPLLSQSSLSAMDVRWSGFSSSGEMFSLCPIIFGPWKPRSDFQSWGLWPSDPNSFGDGSVGFSAAVVVEPSNSDCGGTKRRWALVADVNLVWCDSLFPIKTYKSVRTDFEPILRVHQTFLCNPSIWLDDIMMGISYSRKRSKKFRKSASFIFTFLVLR